MSSGWSPYAREYDPLKAGSRDATDTEPHDHGVVRALSAKYVPDRSITGKPECTVFIARLNLKTTKSTITKFFSEYGKIRKCRLVRDIVTGFSKGYAFVEYEDVDFARKAVHEANRLMIDGKEIFVDYESERVLPGWIPRRLGGGFGGRKESGQLRFGGRDRPFKKPLNLELWKEIVTGDLSDRYRSREGSQAKAGKEFRRKKKTYSSHEKEAYGVK